MDSPLTQFMVKPLVSFSVGGFDLSFTNAALFMLLSTFSIISFLGLGLRKQAAVPGKFQSLVELSYELVLTMLKENVGTKGQAYFPFVFSLFLFVLFGNLLGLLPYAFTFTSQLVLTFGLALLVFIVVTFIGFFKHGLRFFKFFLPEGAPLLMAPLLIPIEVISYLSRPVSLSIRLFANMMAGHTMLKVFALFSVLLGAYGISTILLNTVLIAFEVLVAFLQAYVFSVLTCLYLSDAIHMH
jgi:F-type H+-transporting ATPase subunit a